MSTSVARSLAWWLSGWLLLGSFGCRVCHVPDDYSYSYYGGALARANPYYGRVGSAFDDGTWIEELPAGEADVVSDDSQHP